MVSQASLLNYSHNTCNLNSARSLNLACLFEVGQEAYCNTTPGPGQHQGLNARGSKALPIPKEGLSTVIGTILLTTPSYNSSVYASLRGTLLRLSSRRQTRDFCPQCTYTSSMFAWGASFSCRATSALCIAMTGGLPSPLTWQKARHFFWSSSRQTSVLMMS